MRQGKVNLPGWMDDTAQPEQTNTEMVTKCRPQAPTTTIRMASARLAAGHSVTGSNNRTKQIFLSFLPTRKVAVFSGTDFATVRTPS